MWLQTAACCRRPTCCSMVSLPGLSLASLPVNACWISSSRSSEHQVALNLLYTLMKTGVHTYITWFLLFASCITNIKITWQQLSASRHVDMVKMICWSSNQLLVVGTRLGFSHRAMEFPEVWKRENIEQRFFFFFFIWVLLSAATFRCLGYNLV